MVISLSIALAVVLLFSGYIISNMLKKNEKLEEIAQAQLAFIDSFQDVIEETNRKLIEVDEDGIFKADDEIGFFFASVKSLQEALNDYRSESK